MKIDPGGYFECWDLGEHWNVVGAAFVFAMDCQTVQLHRPEIARAVESPSNRGRWNQNLAAIAQYQARDMG